MNGKRAKFWRRFMGVHTERSSAGNRGERRRTLAARRKQIKRRPR